MRNSSTVALEREFDFAETLLVEGRQDRAAFLLRKLADDGGVPRDLVLRLANLLARAGALEQAVALLEPLVADSRARCQWNDKMAEYCRLISRLGGSHFVLALLSRIPPNASVFQARFVARMGSWLPAQAEADSLGILAHTDSESYAHAIALVNHTHCLGTQGRFEEAAAFGAKAIESLRDANRSLLRCNLHCVLSIAASELDLRQLSREHLAAALELRETARFVDRLFLDRAAAYHALRFDTGICFDEILRNLEDSARRLGHVSTLLDCFRLRAFRSRESTDAAHCYFGHGSREYREIVLRSFERRGIAVPFDCVIGAQEPVVDVATAQGAGFALKPGQAPHRILRAFARDPHRCSTLLALHDRVGDGFVGNLASAFANLRKALKRTQLDLASAGVQSAILENRKDRTFRWNMAACGLRYVRQDLPVGVDDPRLSAWTARLDENFGRAIFSRASLAARYGLSQRHCDRTLDDLLAIGSVEVVRPGFYRRVCSVRGASGGPRVATSPIPLNDPTKTVNPSAP